VYLIFRVYSLVLLFIFSVGVVWCFTVVVVVVVVVLLWCLLCFVFVFLYGWLMNLLHRRRHSFFFFFVCLSVCLPPPFPTVVIPPAHTPLLFPTAPSFSLSSPAWRWAAAPTKVVRRAVTEGHDHNGGKMAAAYKKARQWNLKIFSLFQLHHPSSFTFTILLPSPSPSFFLHLHHPSSFTFPTPCPFPLLA
jgi:predicted PurR-regulated permease PerM